MPKALAELEISHKGLSELIIVEDMHERKPMMAELADGFIALPGGLGTLEELFEMLTWAQLGFHQKPCGALGINAYYQNLVEFLQHTAEEGFVKPQHQDLLLVEAQPKALLKLMQNYKPRTIDKIL
ncbi:TIGR00730 family Rossman fold protein [uncultured Pseudoteredinibacter sp.]|uniref:LOG family protein n=1 Tax=uncultured Pseudoteredinibacter sp. TaxID=1641701 RepID=UPI002613AE2D|nr:TIGR00730 family Rossman fold protein [uncultured Pseudoteredinibacter sp.]